MKKLTAFDLSFYLAFDPKTFDFKYVAAGVIEEDKFSGFIYGYYPNESDINPLGIYENQIVYSIQEGLTTIDSNSHTSVVYAMMDNKPEVIEALEQWETMFFDIEETPKNDNYTPSILLKELMLKGKDTGIVSSADWNIVPPSLFTTHWSGANISKTEIKEFNRKYINK